MAPKHNPKRSGWKRLARVLVIAAVLATALAGLGLWWLSRHPVSIGFLVPRIEAALSKPVAPLSIDVDDVVIVWGGKGAPLDLRVHNARVLQPTGEDLLTIAQLGVDLSVHSLLRGEIKAEGVELIDTRASIIRNRDGSFDFGIPGPDPHPEGTSEEEPAFSLSRWLGSSGIESLLSKLGHIDVRNAEIEVEDRKLGFTWGSDQVGASLKQTERGLEGEFDSSIHVGNDRVHLAATLIFDTTARNLEARLSLADLKPSMLAMLVPDLHRLEGFDRPVRGRIETRLTDELQIRDAQIRLQSDWGGAEATIDIDTELKEVSARIDLSDLKPWLLSETMPELEALAGAHLPIDTRANLKLGNGHLQSLDFELKTKGGELEIGEIFDQPIQISQGELAGRVEDGIAKIEIDKAHIELADGPVLTAQVSAQRIDDRYRSQLVAGLDEIAVGRLSTFWPSGVAVAVDRWIAKHITAGSIHDLTVDLGADLILDETTQFAVGTLTGSFEYEDLQLDLFPPQPAVTGVDGRASFSSQDFDFEVTGGRLADLSVGTSHVTITRLDRPDPALTLDVPVTGPVETVVSFISGEPLSLLPADILTGLSAQIAATLHMMIPLAGPVNMSTMDLAAQGDISELEWEDDAPGAIEVSRGAVALQLSKDSLSLDGSVHLNDVPATIEYREFFQDEDLRRQISAQALLDQEGAIRLGVPEQPYFSVPVDVDFGLAVHRDGATLVDIDADLSKSLLAIPQIGWQKPRGQPGRITAQIERLEKGWRVKSVDLESGDLAVKGSVELASAPFGFLRADLERVQLGKSQVHGSVAKSNNGGYLIDIRGPRIDASPLNGLLPKRGKSVNPEDAVRTTHLILQIEAEVGEILVTPEVSLRHLSVQARSDKQGWQQIDLEMGGQSDSRVVTHFDAAQNGRRLEIVADDLGALARMVDATHRVEGGHLEISATSPSARDPWTAQFVAENFTVRSHRWLERILELGTFKNLLGSLNSDGLEFVRAEGQLTGIPQRLQLASGRVHGQGFGLTAEGWFDFEKKTLDMSGGVFPARVIRKVLGKIPLVKEILYGSKGDRGFATLYEVSGPFDDVRIKANPISTLTPGIVKEIFKLSPKESQPNDK